MSETLFEGGCALESYLKLQEKRMIDAINFLRPEQVRGVDLESLVNHVTEQFRPITPVLREDRKTVPQNDPVPGEQKVHIIVTVPYEGRSDLFRCWSRVPHPVAPGKHGLFCRDDALEFRLVLSAPDTDELTREFNRLLDQIKAASRRLTAKSGPSTKPCQTSPAIGCGQGKNTSVNSMPLPAPCPRWGSS